MRQRGAFTVPLVIRIGVMSAAGVTDAAVLTHIRLNRGNAATPVPSDEVAAGRSR